MDSNHRPRAYQARALTCWAMSPFVSQACRQLSSLPFPLSRLAGNQFPPRDARFRFASWWRWWDSNPWPPACRAGALPAELHPHISERFRSPSEKFRFSSKAHFLQKTSFPLCPFPLSIRNGHWKLNNAERLKPYSFLGFLYFRIRAVPWHSPRSP